MRSHPLSKAEEHISAKLAPEWQDLYGAERRTGPLNYQEEQEETGEDLPVTHIST